MIDPVISPAYAILLGALEGLTEFLPVSSTGHLILASHLLGLRGDAVDAFEIVIQAGALGAVLGLYRHHVAALWRGLLGRDAGGRRLLAALLVSFLPAAVLGFLLHRAIKTHLFSAWPVVWALAVGGIAMILIDRRLRGAPRRNLALNQISVHDALIVGAAQCLALWPGTSRAMVTILAGLLLGWPATVAAEYSFLLALPTLGAATVFAGITDASALTRDVGAVSLLCGFVTSAIVAAAAIRGFIQYVTRRGLAPFGWYRLALAAVVWWTARSV